MSFVELKSVVKRYGSNTVLQDVDLSVEKGEIIAIIGRSGSGKSTLLRCINGLEPVQAGEVWVDAVAVHDPGANLRELRARVGIVFQSFNLFPHLTVERNITLGPMIVKGVPGVGAWCLDSSCRRNVSGSGSQPCSNNTAKAAHANIIPHWRQTGISNRPTSSRTSTQARGCVANESNFDAMNMRQNSKRR